MNLSRAVKRALLSIFAVVALVVGIALGTKTAQAANPIVTNVGYGGGTVIFTTSTAATLTNLDKRPSWITSVTSKAISSYNVQYTIKVAANNNGGTRSFDFVFSGNNGGTYRIRQGGLKNVSVKANKGSTTTYGKGLNETISVNVNWITLYQPTNTTFRIDCAANATGSDRVGYVNVKDGSATVMTYRVTQSASMTAKLDSNGGNFGIYQVQNRDFVPGQKYGTLPTPAAPSGTTFDGWYTAKTGGSKITSNTTVNISYETLYAHWIVKVRLDCNGGNLGTYQGKTMTFSDREFILGENYTNLPTPVAPGYAFNGWYTAKNGGKKITSSNKVTDVTITTLYAHWTANTYTVSFDSQGGSSVSDRTVTFDSTYGTYSNQLKNPTRTGYVFDGWWTAKSGGTRVNYYTTVTTASDHTLYAHWLNTYTIKFDPNGGSGAPGNQTKTHGKDLTISATCPQRTGYEFKGWGTSSTATKVSYAPGAKYTTNAAATLYAVWEPITYKVYFKDEDGETHFCTGKATYGKPYGTLPKATKAGYKQAEWYTEKTGGTRVTSETIVTIAGNHRLYARWTPETYTVYFDNGTTKEKGTVTYGGTYGKLSNPKKDGYTLVGWFTKDGDQITSSTVVKITSEQTLYARWTAITYTISFVAGDGKWANGQNYIQKKYQLGDKILSDVPVKEGYRCVGWSTVERDGLVVYEKGGIFSEYKADILYPVWEPYKVYYDVNADGDDIKNGPSTHPWCPDISNYLAGSPKRNGYVFVGWTTEIKGVTFLYNPGAKRTELKEAIKKQNGDITLHGIWRPEAIDIEHNSDDKGYTYKYTGLVMAGETARIKVDIPALYTGYYKLDYEVVSSIDGGTVNSEGITVSLVNEEGNDCFIPESYNWRGSGYWHIDTSREDRSTYLIMKSEKNVATLVSVTISSAETCKTKRNQSFVWKNESTYGNLDLLEVYISQDDLNEFITQYDMLASAKNQNRTFFGFIKQEFPLLGFAANILSVPGGVVQDEIYEKIGEKCAEEITSAIKEEAGDIRLDDFTTQGLRLLTFAEPAEALSSEELIENAIGKYVPVGLDVAFAIAQKIAELPDDWIKYDTSEFSLMDWLEERIYGGADQLHEPEIIHTYKYDNGSIRHQVVVQKMDEKPYLAVDAPELSEAAKEELKSYLNDSKSSAFTGLFTAPKKPLETLEISYNKSDKSYGLHFAIFNQGGVYSLVLIDGDRIQRWDGSPIEFRPGALGTIDADSAAWVEALYMLSKVSSSCVLPGEQGTILNTMNDINVLFDRLEDYKGLDAGDKYNKTFEKLDMERVFKNLRGKSTN